MALSESHREFAFKIEPKAEGGFVSTSDNPELACEGATREEVEREVLEKIGALGGPEMAALVGSLESALENMEKTGGVPGEKKFAISIDRKISFAVQTNKLGRGEAAAGPLQLGAAPQPSVQPFAEARSMMSPAIKILIVLAALILIALVYSIFRSS